MSPDRGVRARRTMLAGIRREMLGPAGCGHALNITTGVTHAEDAYLPFVDAETGEEVLTVEFPLQRYGLGVLFPKEEADLGSRP